jgi:hypothetical protein
MNFNMNEFEFYVRVAFYNFGIFQSIFHISIYSSASLRVRYVSTLFPYIPVL